MLDQSEKEAIFARCKRDAGIAARELVSVLERRRPDLTTLRRAERRASAALAELRMVAAALASHHQETK